MEKSTMTVTAEGAKTEVIKAPGQIYELIGKAIGKIGAIGKDQMNLQQKFKYRGIDQVYNALNPVMAELGIFICPEVLDMKREERETKNGTVLTYTILTMKYTVYAPDGSHITMTVMGEGMDSGDKGCNKAMSVAMKYAMFQLFCIPTEEMKDPDADVYTDVLPRGARRPQEGQKQAENGSVSRMDKLPAGKDQEGGAVPEQPETTASFIKRRIMEINREKAFNFMEMRAELIKTKQIEDIPSATMTMEQAKKMMDAIEANVLRAG